MTDRPAPLHVPVMLEETVQALAVQPGGRYVDCTVGAGGHAAAILSHSMPGGQLLGIDIDPEAIAAARKNLARYSDSCVLVNDDYANLEAICIRYDFIPVHGVFFDLGLSSLQLESSERGFSFRQEGPLDMRFDPKQEITAAEIVNSYPKAELADIIRNYGEERHAYRIADFIARKRPIGTTLELASVIEQAVGGRRERIHPATRTFQALRIAVNQELERLESGLKQAIQVLGGRGRLVVISYHSLEDRIVKNFTREEARDCICPPGTPACVCEHTARLRVLTRKVITPTPEEIEQNPRSRSARLRAAERIMSESEYVHSPETGFCTAGRANGWRNPIMLKKIRAAFSAAA